jgi:hypothetical protein
LPPCGLELEDIDRGYLNAYVASLQTGAVFVYFVKKQLGATFRRPWSPDE